MNRPPRPAAPPRLARRTSLLGRGLRGWLLGGLAVGLLAVQPAGAGLAVAVALLGPSNPLATVRDDTRGVLHTETAAYEQVFAAVHAVDPAELVAEAAAFRAERREALNLRPGRPFPVFPDLFNHPQAYRGQAVTLIGQARRIRDFPAGPTAANPDELRVELAIYTDDSQTNPAIVVAAAAPLLPRGDDLMEPVTVTGRFFKRWGYDARDKRTRVAPLILAATVEPAPLSTPPPAGPFVLGLTAAVTIVGLSAGAWAWWLRPKRRRGTVAAGGGEAPDLGGYVPPPDDESGVPHVK